jgi:hypothetical protein
LGHFDRLLGLFLHIPVVLDHTGHAHTIPGFHSIIQNILGIGIKENKKIATETKHEKIV